MLSRHRLLEILAGDCACAFSLSIPGWDWCESGSEFCKFTESPLVTCVLGACVISFRTDVLAGLI